MNILWRALARRPAVEVWPAGSRGALLVRAGGVCARQCIVPVQTTDVVNVVRIYALADAVLAAEWQ